MKKSILYSLILLIAVGVSFFFFNFKTIGNVLLEEVIGVPNYSDYDYSPSYDVFNNDAPLFTLSDDEFVVSDNDSIEFEVEVDHEGGLVWKYGYFRNSTGWERFTLAGTPEKNADGTDSNWLNETGDADLNITVSKLRVNNYNFIVTYSCKKYADQWKCGCNSNGVCGKWMLQLINITNESIQLPGPQNGDWSSITYGLNWQEATNYCSNLGNGWKLPLRSNLTSVSFPHDFGSQDYWTSETHSGLSDYRYTVKMDVPQVTSYQELNINPSTRCIYS